MKPVLAPVAAFIALAVTTFGSFSQAVEVATHDDLSVEQIMEQQGEFFVKGSGLAINGQLFLAVSASESRSNRTDSYDYSQDELARATNICKMLGGKKPTAMTITWKPVGDDQTLLSVDNSGNITAQFQGGDQVALSDQVASFTSIGCRK